MNGTLCADVVSRLPNEVSNYEPCYFLCGAGCDQGEEGTQREEEVEEGGIEREQWMRDRRVKKGNPNNVRQRQQQRERASTHY